MLTILSRIEKNTKWIYGLCIALIIGWYAQMKISFFSEAVSYSAVTLLVLIVMALTSLPGVLKKRRALLLRPAPILFALLLTASAVPHVLQYMPSPLTRIAAFAAVFLFFWIFFAGFADFLRLRAACRPASEPTDGRKVFWAVFCLSLLAFALLLVLYPHAHSPDMDSQREQIFGEAPYSNVHAIAHTILLSVCYRIYDHPYTAIIPMMIATALMYGLYGKLLYRKGVPRSWIYLLLTILLVNEQLLHAFVFPFKDTPYTLCIGLATYLLIQTLDKRGAIGIPTACAAGVCIAFIYLFRLNGIIAAAMLLGAFVFWCIRAKRVRSCIALAAVTVFCIAGVNLYADRVLHVEKPDNGFSLQVFGSGIAAVVANDGRITPEQQREIDSFLSAEWMKEKYTPYENSRLIWDVDGSEKDPETDPGVFNNQFVLALGAHPEKVVRLYLSLLPHNIGICVRDILYNTYLIWGIKDSSLIPRFYDTNIFMTALTAFAVLTLWKRRHADLPYLGVFFGVFFNMVSIAISTITNEKRYLLATFVLTPVLLLYVLARAREDDGIAPSEAEVPCETPPSA